MAYPTISAPYGFKPINRFDGIPYAGATLQYPITASTAIYYGDTVKLVAGGTISQSGATTTGTIIGVFVGCQYVNSSGQTVQAQYCPSSGVTNPIAYVVVDPVAEFKVAVTTTGNTSVVTGANATIIGTNVAQTAYTAGSTTTGDSLAGVAVSAAATGTAAIVPLTSSAAFRIVGVVPASAVTVSNGGTTSGTTLTLSAANSAILPGMVVTGAGINNGSNTYVTSVNGTTVTLNVSVGTNQASTQQYSFTGYPEALVTWNFGYHSYFNATGV